MKDTMIDPPKVTYSVTICSKRTHQLNVIDSFVPKALERCDCVLVNGEGHSLQSLLLGVHADVRLHLNTPQDTRHFNLTSLTHS